MKKIKIFLFLIIFFILGQFIFCKGNTEEDLSGEYFAIAEAYSEVKNYDKAIDYYKKAEKNDNYKNASKYNLARLYAVKSDWKNCLDILKPMYNQVPNNLKIATAYAYALASSGATKEALFIYKKILLKNPDTTEYCFNYARLLIIVKDYDEAKKILNTAREKFTQTNEIKIIEDLEKKIEEALKSTQESTTNKTEKDNKK